MATDLRLMTDSNPLVSKPEPLADGLIVRVTSEVDFSQSPVLRDSLVSLVEGQSPKRLVIDLGEVPYMDSSGVATLVEVLQVQKRMGGKLVLCNLQPKVLGIFEIARLDMLFTIVPDAQQAGEA